MNRPLKYSILLDKSTGFVGVSLDERSKQEEPTRLLLVDIKPEPTYYQARVPDLLLLGWIVSNSNIQAFQRIPRTFHELSQSARVNLGFLPKGSEASFYTDRRIRKVGEDI